MSFVKSTCHLPNLKVSHIATAEEAHEHPQHTSNEGVAPEVAGQPYRHVGDVRRCLRREDLLGRRLRLRRRSSNAAVLQLLLLGQVTDLDRLGEADGRRALDPAPAGFGPLVPRRLDLVLTPE